jgi:enoyl-CoA hydratase/carnithine racemase
MADHVTSSIKDGVCTIRLNRADKKNALTHAMYDKMTEALKAADADPAARVIMITGTGDSFCAGNDLKDFLENPPQGKNSPVLNFLKALTETKLPVVAAVNGTAVGVGVTMLLHCDFVYIAKGTQLSLPFVDLGLVPEAAASMLLPHTAGHARAAELLMLGEPFTPEQAVELGIANAVCPQADVEATALKTAQRLAAKPRQALLQTKALMRAAFETVAQRIDREAEVFKECLNSPDAKEAFTAFKEKRKPKFS